MNLRIPIVIVAAALLGGCTGSSKSGDASKPGAIQVGMVFDSGGLGDKSFNDSANAGLQKAKADFGIEPKTVQSQSEKDYATNLDAMASGGCKVVFAVGGAQSNALKLVAPRYPDVKFAIIDADVDAPNVRSLDFSEEQGSFLAGYLAALMSKNHKLGFVGGEELELIKKFYAGYVAGAKTADPAVEVLPAKYVGNWESVDTAHADAQQLLGSGADIIYHAAGRAGLGVINAAKEQNVFAIGVDSDQDYLAEGRVLTSMIKHVDKAVYETISDYKGGKFTAGEKRFDLASGGVGLSPMTYTKDKIGALNIGKVDAIAAEIKSGKIKVPATLDELAKYLAAIPQKK